MRSLSPAYCKGLAADSNYCTDRCGLRNHNAHGKWGTHPLLLSDHGEQVTLVSVIHNNVYAVVLLDETVHADDGAMTGSAVVKLDLAKLEATLPLIDAVTAKLLDCTLDGPAIKVVESIVDNTVGTSANLGDQLNVTVVDEAGLVGRTLGRHDVVNGDGDRCVIEFTVVGVDPRP